MKHKKIIALVLLIVAAVFGANAQKTYLVCVGLGNYDDGQNPLPCSRADMESIARFYNGRGNCDVFMLIDKNATRDHILRVLKSKFSKAGPKDQIIFAYSGHGFDGGVSTYNHKDLIYCAEIQKIMQTSKAARKMMFVMSCHSGSFSKQYNKRLGDGYKSNNKNVLLYMSSRANESSWERADMENSFFYFYLMMALQGYADANNDGNVTARELFNFVNEGVIRATGGRQHPQMYGKFPDDMIIIKTKR